MTLLELENLLKTSIGLDASTIGSGAVERAIRERMNAGGFKTIEGYWNSVCSSPIELQELVEAVVVPETWFFRDAQAFTALSRLVREEWLPKHPTDVLRVLSVPCSTGEEAYSIAICLHASGLSRYEIEAVDISHRALSKANRGIYGRNSFRGADLEFRNNYFEKQGSLYELMPFIRNGIHFAQGNLLGEHFAANRPKYDFIFCRNLLIYFDAETQKRSFAMLKSMLADDGVLFVGPSEGTAAVNHGFASVKIPLAFAFRKATAKPRTAKIQKLTDERFRNVAPAPKKIANLTKPAPLQPVAPASPPQPRGSNLSIARQWADAGKLEDAAQLCHASILEHGASAEAFYLLGLVQDASNSREQAREFYRKALYLEPNHYDALVHLALLTKSLGDAAGARLLEARAERVKQTTK